MDIAKLKAKQDVIISKLVEKAKQNADSIDFLDDMVHYVKSKEATGINNAGFKLQIGFLVRNGCADMVEEKLKELNGD
jgi:hypothetical protein